MKIMGTWWALSTCLICQIIVFRKTFKQVQLRIAQTKYLDLRMHCTIFKLGLVFCVNPVIFHDLLFSFLSHMSSLRDFRSKD